MAQLVGRGIALLFHDRGTRRGWVVSSTPRPHFTPGKHPVPIVQEAGWALEPVWTGGKTHPHRDSIPDRPARSQSLYRLSYRVHTHTHTHTHTYIYIFIFIYLFIYLFWISKSRTWKPEDVQYDRNIYQVLMKQTKYVVAADGNKYVNYSKQFVEWGVICLYCQNRNYVPTVWGRV